MNKNDNIIELVNNGMLNFLSEDNKFAKDYLEDNGFDMNTQLKLAQKELRKRFALDKAIKKQLSDSSLLDKAMKRLRELNIQKESLDTNALQASLRNSGIGLAFRNLENWSDDEMREALNDVDLIKLLEELKKLDS